MQKDYHEIKVGDQTLIYPVALEDKVKAGILAMQKDLGVEVSWSREPANQPNNIPEEGTKPELMPPLENNRAFDAPYEKLQQLIKDLRVDDWIAQGRSEEAIWGLKNGLTGLVGANVLKMVEASYQRGETAMVKDVIAHLEFCREDNYTHAWIIEMLKSRYIEELTQEDTHE